MRCGETARARAERGGTRRPEACLLWLHVHARFRSRVVPSSCWLGPVMPTVLVYVQRSERRRCCFFVLDAVARDVESSGVDRCHNAKALRLRWASPPIIEFVLIIVLQTKSSATVCVKPKDEREPWQYGRRFISVFSTSTRSYLNLCNVIELPFSSFP